MITTGTIEAMDHQTDDTPQREPSADDDRRQGDRGFTYVEVVITIVLMGIVVLPILAAVRSSIQAASVSRSAAEVETVLINAADRVNRADRDDYPCDLTDPAKGAAAAQGAPWSTDNITVQHAYWNGGGWTSGLTACDMDSTTFRPPGTIQRFTIRVTSPDGGVSREIEVVKSDF